MFQQAAFFYYQSALTRGPAESIPRAQQIRHITLIAIRFLLRLFDPARKLFDEMLQRKGFYSPADGGSDHRRTGATVDYNQPARLFSKGPLQ